MALPKLESRVTVPTGGWDVAVTDSGGSDTITIPAGDYYIGGSTSILDTFETALNASGTLNATYTLTQQHAATVSGKTNIGTTGGGNPSFTWTDTDFRDVLGYTGNLSGATFYLSTNSSPHTWLPEVGRTNVLSPEPSSTAIQMGASEFDYIVTRSPSGGTTTLAYNERYNDTLEFSNLVADKVWKEHEDLTNESFQTWIQKVHSTGGVPFKYFPDKDDSTVAWQFVFGDLSVFQPTPVVPGWVGSKSIWSISYPIWKK